MSRTVIGIDVGGEKKGFHAIALCDGKFVGQMTDIHPNVIVEWCLDHRAEIVGVDAPCLWSRAGSSRMAEREIKIAGEKVHCFATPTRERALHRKFYQWVFNGERLYKCLETQYPLFDGQRKSGRVCFETFPHAIVCAMAGRVISAKSKGTVRRNVLQRRGYDDRDLHNIDFVDAALCAVAADALCNGSYQIYGDPTEGFIVVPKIVKQC
jgi:predicted nuclease with RNAse H fold